MSAVQPRMWVQIIPEGPKGGCISISNASRQGQEEVTKRGGRRRRMEAMEVNVKVSHCHTPEHMLPVVANSILTDPDQKHI